MIEVYFKRRKFLGPSMKNSGVIFCVMCRRFKSGMSCDKLNRAQAIMRLRRENKLLYGELLESPKTNQKRLEKLNSNDDKTNINSNEQTKSDAERFEEVVPFSVKSKLKKVNIRARKFTHDECSKRSIQTYSACWVPDNNFRASEFLHLDRNDVKKSLLSFPLLNLKKDKYIVNDNAKELRIGSLMKYYPDYNSVSEILGKSMSLQSEANLERWRANMISKLGPEEFESYNKNQMSQGSMFRTKVLNYLNGVPEEEIKINEELRNYWLSVKAAFPVIQSVVDTGGLVAHPHLKYKGAFDCLAVFRNEVVLVSWKKSEKFVASMERTFDIPLQIAAFMGALNFDDRYPFRVEQALLVMAYGDGSKADLFHLNEEKCVHYWKQWLERLNTYLERIEDEEQRKDQEKVPKTQVANEQQSVPEKIDIDHEVEKIISSGYQASPQIIKESKLNENRGDELILQYPLTNPKKVDYEADCVSAIQPSLIYENNAYPSVSTILSETKSEAAKFILQRWRQTMIEKLGLDGFAKYEKETLEAGSTLHEYLRMRFSEGLGSEGQIPKNIQGFWQSLSPVFPLISNVQITESKVAHPLCKYRGIIDCIGFFQDKLVVIDWKTSEKIKSSVSKTYDAPLQIAAYIGALNFDPSYPFKVDEGLLVVAYGDGTKANVFHLDKEKCLKYWKRWLERVNQYQTMAYKDGTKIQY